MPNDAPAEVEEDTTVPVPVQTNRELVYGTDDSLADDAGFLEAVRWDGEALR